MSHELPTLVVINGPAGVGKSTTAGVLAKGKKASALISGDRLKQFLIAVPEDSRASRVSYRNAAAICQELLDSGFLFIVYDFVFDSVEKKSEFLAHLNPAVKFRVHFVTLWASEEVVLSRRSARIEDRQFSDLMNNSWQIFFERLDSPGTILHTDGLTAEQVSQRIEQLLHDNKERHITWS